MKGPISFALAYPWGRVPGAVSRLDLATLGSLHFEALDREKFPFVDIARTCIREGGNRSLVFNTANEVAVAAFLRGELRFDRIFTFVQKCVEKLQGAAPVHFEELYGMVEAVRSSAAEMLR
jgi:1-deoxy-D-xylulose-5-phosphate reductoisomerase